MEQGDHCGPGRLGILYGHALTQCLGPDKVTFLAEGERLNQLRQEEAGATENPASFRSQTIWRARLSCCCSREGPGSGGGHGPGRPYVGRRQ